MRSPSDSRHELLTLWYAVFAAAALLVGGHARIAAAQPHLIVDPNPVKSGENATVHGVGFCGAPECSAIVVQVDGQVVVDAARPRRDGSVSVTFEARAEPGRHEVVMRQARGTTGAPVETSAELLLGVGEMELGEEKEAPGRD